MCSVISGLGAVLNQDLRVETQCLASPGLDYVPCFWVCVLQSNGYFAHRSVVKNRTCVFRKSAVLNQDFQDWKDLQDSFSDVFGGFGGGRCLEPGFSGLERIHRILVWGCIVLLGVPSPFPVYRIF